MPLFYPGADMTTYIPNGCLDTTSHSSYLVSLLYQDLGSNSQSDMQYTTTIYLSVYI
jgi:hypothetical protein